MQLPTLGVAIDAAGVLQTQIFQDVTGQLTALRRQMANRSLSTDVQKSSRLRFISLKRLERAIEKCLRDGRPLTDEMQKLAGLQRVKYVFASPNDQDILIAGPAEGWMEDLSGRVVGINTGKPTVLLCDLITAMRVFAPRRNVNTWVAISIDPTRDGMQRFKEYTRKMPNRIPDRLRSAAAVEFAKGIRSSLGLASVRVHGLPRTSHLTKVMVEADYRMKLMAIGLEEPPIRMSTFIGELKGQPRGLQRWWLVPNYKCVRQANDQQSMELVGRGVQLKTEVIYSTPAGHLAGVNANAKKHKPSRAARKYAESFTDRYEELSAARPVYAQLRNVIDVLIACAWILKSDSYNRAGWAPSILLDEDQVPVNDQQDIKQAHSVANAVWKGRVLLLPAGGGVSVQASTALHRSNLLLDADDKLPAMAGQIRLPTDERWWWDSK